MASIYNPDVEFSIYLDKQETRGYVDSTIRPRIAAGLPYLRVCVSSFDRSRTSTLGVMCEVDRMGFIYHYGNCFSEIQIAGREPLLVHSIHANTNSTTRGAVQIDSISVNGEPLIDSPLDAWVLANEAVAHAIQPTVVSSKHRLEIRARSTRSDRELLQLIVWCWPTMPDMHATITATQLLDFLNRNSMEWVPECGYWVGSNPQAVAIRVFAVDVEVDKKSCTALTKHRPWLRPFVDPRVLDFLCGLPTWRRQPTSQPETPIEWKPCVVDDQDVLLVGYTRPIPTFDVGAVIAGRWGNGSTEP